MMNDEEQIKELYIYMYEAMIKKDADGLGKVLSDNFCLHHMTGMVQTKPQYVDAILNGALNYYSAEHENMEIHVSGDNAGMVGDSKVAAAVFGGGKNMWRLRQRMKLHKENGRWLFDESVASTY